MKKTKTKKTSADNYGVTPQCLHYVSYTLIHYSLNLLGFVFAKLSNGVHRKLTIKFYSNNLVIIIVDYQKIWETLFYIKKEIFKLLRALTKKKSVTRYNCLWTVGKLG